MKANGAPEKIYMSPAGVLYKGDKQQDNDIEYTRTDAFIKKVVIYLNSKLYDWVQTTNPNQRSYANTIMKEDFIEDFKKVLMGDSI